MVDQLGGTHHPAEQEQRVGASPPMVFIATPMYGGMAMGSYVSSLAQTGATFIRHGLGLLYQYRMNDALVANARNVLAHQFLQSQATHLMWIDADIGFNPTDIVSMVLADQDIVCGVYPMKGIDWKRVAQAVNDGVPPEELKGHVGAFVVEPLDGVPADPDGLVEIASGGAGFMLIKRGVLVALSHEVAEYAIEGAIVKEFYTTGIDPESSQLVSEDFYFCRLARSFGFKVHAAPWVRLTHTGPYLYESQLHPDWLT